MQDLGSGPSKGKEAPSFDEFARDSGQWPPYPPPGETELEKALRLEEEREAKRISDAIDQALELEMQSTRRQRKGETRLLLLGTPISPCVRLSCIHVEMLDFEFTWRLAVRWDLSTTLTWHVTMLPALVYGNIHPQDSPSRANQRC